MNSALLKLFAILLLALLGCGADARAESVLVSTSRMIEGAQSLVYEFEVTGPGIVTAQVTDLAWTERFAALSFGVSTIDGIFLRRATEGALEFEPTGPARYFLHVTGRASGVFNLGLVGVNVRFQAAAPPVPLPAAVWLLLGGAAMLRLSQGRMRASRAP